MAHPTLPPDRCALTTYPFPNPLSVPAAIIAYEVEVLNLDTNVLASVTNLGVPKSTSVAPVGTLVSPLFFGLASCISHCPTPLKPLDRALTQRRTQPCPLGLLQVQLDVPIVGGDSGADFQVTVRAVTDAGKSLLFARVNARCVLD